MLVALPSRIQTPRRCFRVHVNSLCRYAHKLQIWHHETGLTHPIWLGLPIGWLFKLAFARPGREGDGAVRLASAFSMIRSTRLGVSAGSPMRLVRLGASGQGGRPVEAKRAVLFLLRVLALGVFGDGGFCGEEGVLDLWCRHGFGSSCL